MSIKLDGIKLRDKILEGLEIKVKELKSRGVTPCMQVFLAGDNPASLVYIKNKEKACKQIGANFILTQVKINISEEEFHSLLKHANDDQMIHGILVQQPLPSNWDAIKINRLIHPLKDVDGLHPDNVYELYTGISSADSLISCTPRGIIRLLKEYDIELTGKNTVIIGRSLIVGKPLALLMNQLNATVTLCHSQTKDLESLTKKADIIVCALGKPGFLQAKHLSMGKRPVIIDVGINKKANGSVVGDVNLDEVISNCEYYTPVPGGVGPMTIASLMENLVLAAEKQRIHA